jgi:hypothetical protein
LIAIDRLMIQLQIGRERQRVDLEAVIAQTIPQEPDRKP